MNVLMILTTGSEGTQQFLSQLYEKIGERKRSRSPYKSEQEIPMELRKNIVDFLLSLPNVHDKDFRRALINNAEIDDELDSQIAYDSTPSRFFSLLVSMSMDYGMLMDGRHALEAILEAAKQYIGQDKKEDCERLIWDLYKMTDSPRTSQSHQPLHDETLLTFRVFWATHTQGIQKALLEFPPNIVHFVGHNTEKSGIPLEDASGNIQFLNSSILVNMLKNFATQVTCVVLDTCNNTSQAKAIAQYIAYTIGIPSLLKKKMSIEFMAAFYDALDAGKSVEFAYSSACNALYAAKIQNHLMPVLLRKDEGDLSRWERVSQADRQYRLGVDYFKEHELSKAKESLHTALSLNPEQIDAQILLGRVYIESVELPKALEILEHAYQSDPVKAQDYLLHALKATIKNCQEPSQKIELYERIEQIRTEDRLSLDLSGQLDALRRSMQGTADLGIQLLNQQDDLIWQDELILQFHIKNTGNAPANKVSMTLSESKSYHIIGDAFFKTDFIPPGESYHVIYRIRPLRQTFSLHLSYAYVDVIEKQEFFDQPIQLMSQPDYQFEPLVNPYRSGSLIKELQRGNTEMFFGRKDTIEELRAILIHDDEGLVIIYGQRRAGKSCLMKYIEKAREFEPDLHIVFVDMQGISSEQRFYTKILKPLANMTDTPQEFNTNVSSFEEFTESLEELTGAITPRILIIIDEFENITSQHFTYTSLPDADEFIKRMRHLLQYTPDVKFALAGADKLKKMVEDHRNPLFKAGQTFRIAFLSPQDARDLITQPLADKITYTEQAIAAIQEASYNQPYYIQCLCQKIVWLLNKKKSYTVTLTEVKEAIEDIEKTEKGMFEYVWDTTCKESHLVLAVLAEEMQHRTWIPDDRIEKVIQESDVQVNEELIDESLQELLERDFAVDNGNLEYMIPVGLLSTWIKRYKPLKRVRREFA